MRLSESKADIYIYFPNRSSAVLSIGAATLADIFDPAVRGKKVGVTSIGNIVSMAYIVFEDRDLLRSTIAWTGNFSLCIGQNLDFSFYPCPRRLGPYLEVY